MQNHVFVSKHPVAILQKPVFNPKGTFATCETLFHFQNTLLQPSKTMFQFQNLLLQPATAVFKIIGTFTTRDSHFQNHLAFSRPVTAIFKIIYLFHDL